MIQTPQLTDPQKTDTSTKRQLTNCTLSFAIIENDRLHEGLNYLMVKMRTQDGGRSDRGRIEGGRGRQTKSGVRLVGFETVAPGGLWGKKRVSRPEKL